MDLPSALEVVSGYFATLAAGDPTIMKSLHPPDFEMAGRRIVYPTN